MLGRQKGKKKNEYVPDYVIFDFETTGTSCQTDQVVEIAAVKVQGGAVTEEFSTLVNPGRSIPYYASQVNDITDDMVADAPTLRQALSDFLAFAGDLPLVGHNIHSFDMKFLYRDCEELFGQLPCNDYIDTLYLARICLPELTHHRLTDLAEHYALSTDGAHRALNDCRMNQAVYERLGEVLAEALSRQRVCPRCGELLVKRNGKFGSFWGCGGFPNCRYTERV